MMPLRKIGLLALPLSLSLTGCALLTPEPPVPPLDLTQVPPVAADYVTARTHDHTAATTHNHANLGTLHWRFYRNDNRIETENLTARTGETWVRDGKSLFMTMLFHDDKKGIEYRLDDLGNIGMPLSWPRKQLLVEPQELKKLQETDARWDNGHPVRTYEGEIEGQQLSITWRVDLNIPAAIERRHQGNTEITTLTEALPLASSPWKQRDASNYLMIDYTDLGDMERDPFVMRIQDHLPGGHQHAH